MIAPLESPNMNIKTPIIITGVLSETRNKTDGEIRKVSPGISRMPKNIAPIMLAVHKGNFLR